MVVEGFDFIYFVPVFLSEENSAFRAAESP